MEENSIQKPQFNEKASVVNASGAGFQETVLKLSVYSTGKMIYL